MKPVLNYFKLALSLMANSLVSKRGLIFLEVCGGNCLTVHLMKTSTVNFLMSSWPQALVLSLIQYKPNVYDIINYLK